MRSSSDHRLYSSIVAQRPNTRIARASERDPTLRYQDGKCTHWYANGRKPSETNYEEGKYHGRSTDWYENGQIHSVNEYKDGVKHGIEASWDERGDLHYERRYVNGQLVD